MFKLIVLVLAHRLPSNGIHHLSSPPLQHLTQWGSGERLGWVQKTLAGWTCITQSFLDSYTGCRWSVFQITTSWGQYLPLQKAPVGPPTLPPMHTNSPTWPVVQGRCEYSNLRLVHLWEPGALLQPWQHCPPQTLILKQNETPESSDAPFPKSQAFRTFLKSHPLASAFLWIRESSKNTQDVQPKAVQVERLRDHSFTCEGWRNQRARIPRA